MKANRSNDHPLAEALLVAVSAGDAHAVAALLDGVSEVDRRAAAPVILRVDPYPRLPASASQRPPVIEREEQRLALSIAKLGVASISEVQKHDLNNVWDASGALVAVLGARSDDWRARWLQSIYEQRRRPWDGPGWTVVRQMISDGLLPAVPTDDRYIEHLLGTRTKAVELLAAHPEMLDDEVWRLFEVEGTPEASLASSAKFTDAGWSEALAALSAEGRLDRDRLLDATLGALARDWGAYRASWYVGFWKRLAPSDGERVARTSQLLLLLSSSARAVVGFAVDEIRAVAASELSEAQASAIVDALVPAFGSGVKKTILRSLAIVTKLVEGGVGADQAAQVAIVGLSHGKADVQRTLLDRIAKWQPDPSPAVLQALRAAQPTIAASERPRIDALLATADDDGRGDESTGGLANASCTGVADVPSLDDLEARIDRLPADVTAALGLRGALRDADAPFPTGPIDGKTIPANRVAGRLSSLGGISPLHRSLSRELLERTVVLPSRPTNLASLLELLDEWCAEDAVGIKRPETRDFLTSLSGSSKSARLARSLLARTGAVPAHEHALRLDALVRRGERWARLANAP